MGYSPPPLDVRKVAGGYTIYTPGSVTTDDIDIYANLVDTTSRIKMYGGGGISLFYTALDYINMISASTITTRFGYISPDAIIECPIDAKNIFLKTTGTGKIKVPGSANATGDVACNGNYQILDSTGATIKLMTCA